MGIEASLPSASLYSQWCLVQLRIPTSRLHGGKVVFLQYSIYLAQRVVRPAFSVYQKFLSARVFICLATLQY